MKKVILCWGLLFAALLLLAPSPTAADHTDPRKNPPVKIIPDISGLLYSEDFEPTDGGFVGSGALWEHGNPSVGPASCHSTTRCWATQLNGNYPDSSDEYLTSPIIDTSTGPVGEDIYLTWWEWRDMENCCDSFYLEVKDGGGTWTQVYGPVNGNNGGWAQNGIQLPYGTYAIANFQFRFHFTSDVSLNYNGVYIDDIEINTIAPPPTLTVPYFSDFEVDNGALTNEPLWQWGAPVSGPGSAYSGANVWGTDLLSNYPSNSDASLVSPLFDTTAVTSANLELSWWEWRNSELTWDFLYVDASNNGGSSWTTVYGPVSGVNGGWAQQIVSLPVATYGVVDFQFRFRFTSDFSGNYPGIFIDDLRLREESPLELVKSAPAVVGDGSVIDYELVVSNVSAGATNGVVLTDTLPAGTTYVPASVTTVGGAPAAVYNGGPNSINWTGNLAAGQVITISFQATESGALSTIVNDVYVDYTTLSAPMMDSATTMILPTYVAPYTENFESGDGDYTVTGFEWEYGSPTSGPGGAFSGTNLWATILNADYTANANAELISPIIDTTALAGDSMLISWQEWRDTELNYDHFYVDVSADGGTGWTQIYGPANGNNAGWQRESVILNDAVYAVPNFRIRFRFTSDVASNYAGIYLDDILVANDSPILLSKSAPQNASVNSPLPYEIVVTNPGGSPVSSVNITDTIPAGATYVPGSLVTLGVPAAVESGGEVTWGGNLAAGQSVTITFNVTTPGAPGTLLNSVFGSVTGSPPPPPASASTMLGTDMIIAGDPLTIYIPPNGSYQVSYAGQGLGQAYPQAQTPGADSGIFAWYDGVAVQEVIAPNFEDPTYHDWSAVGTTTWSQTWTMVSQSGISGIGTMASPWLVTTDLASPDGLLTNSVRTSYINGDPYFRIEWDLCTTNPGPVTTFLAGDLYLQGSDQGIGYYDATSGSVGGFNSDSTWYEIFTPIRPADHYMEDSFSLVWDAIGTADAPGVGLNDTIDPALIDNGASLQWDLNVNGCETVSAYWSFGQLPQPPTAVQMAMPAATSASQAPSMLIFWLAGMLLLTATAVLLRRSRN